MLDRGLSGGSWGGGAATFARIGGDGRHGSFDPNIPSIRSLGTVNGKNTFEIDTQGTTIPAENTLTGSPIAISDGRFYFDEFVVPADTRLRFVGGVPPVITVAGRIDVLGEIDMQGETLPYPPSPYSSVGQKGGGREVNSPLPAFGGRGGNGGDKCFGTGPSPAYNGNLGETARVRGGHGYATTAATTGGRGSTIFPSDGLNSSLIFASGIVTYTPSASAGGGGGGLWTPGQPGRVVDNNHADPGFTGLSTGATATTLTMSGASWVVDRYAGRTVTITSGVGQSQVRTIASNTADTLTVTSAWAPLPTASGFSILDGPAPRRDAMGPPAPAGTALQLFPFPAPSGLSRSSEHFLVGGSGGGGAASNAALAISVSRTWVSGGGGGGGGGAIALRAGDSLTLGALGKLLASGGGAGSIGSSSSGIAAPAPGGGGSGGSIVLQAGRLSNLGGVIDVQGGRGGTYNRSSGGPPPSGAQVQIAGGDGGPGFVRFEMPTSPSTSQLSGMVPAAVAENVGTLTEIDDLSSFRSTWYSTGLVFGPIFARYEIHATVNGVSMVFSDDPAVSSVQAGPGSPLQFWIQAGQLNLTTNEVLETRPWRTGVRTTAQQTGIASDGLNGFRFVIIRDGTISNLVEIDKLIIFYLV